MGKVESVRLPECRGSRVLAARAAVPSCMRRRRIPCVRALPAAIAPALGHLRKHSSSDHKQLSVAGVCCAVFLLFHQHIRQRPSPGADAAWDDHSMALCMTWWQSQETPAPVLHVEQLGQKNCVIEHSEHRC